MSQLRFKIIPEEETPTQTIVLKTEGNQSHPQAMSGLDTIIGNWVSEQLRKSLEKKDEKEKKDDKPKAKSYSGSDVTCWSLLLLASAPWTGLWILRALDAVKLQWIDVLHAAVK